MKSHEYIKAGLGALVFLFSLGLAYFSAEVFDNSEGVDHNTLYWIVLLVSGGVYTLIGMFISRVLPVAFGLLLSASVLFGHTLLENYDKFDSELKMLVTGIILAVLYMLAFRKFSEKADLPQVSQA